MSRDPYRAGMIKRDIFLQRRAIVGELVALMDSMLESRGLALISPRSRAVLVNEMHELILTDEQHAGPDKTVNTVLAIGFVEIRTGGVILVGDEVLIGDIVIGKVAGFDVTHMPNHMNIVVAGERVRPKAKLGDEVIIAKREGKDGAEFLKYSLIERMSP